MGSIIGKMVVLLGGVLTGLLGGWRTWVGAVLVKGILIVCIYNLFTRIITESFTWVLGIVQGIDAPGGSVGTMSIASYTALGAWVANTTKLPQCFAFMLSCVLLKWSFRKIPFLRW